MARPFDSGADRLELLVDRERGLVLRRVAFIDDEPFMTRELRAIAFDEPIDGGLFHFEPPPGAQVHRLGEDSRPPAEQLGLEGAARRCPFTMLAPTRLPGCAHPQVTFWPAGGRPPQKAQISIHYRFDDASHILDITEHPDRQRYNALRNGDQVRPDRVEHEGVTYEVHETGMAQRTIQFEREGTHVTMHTDLDFDTAIEIAKSMHQAPHDPPELG
jgi:hypothetical protein